MTRSLDIDETFESPIALLEEAQEGLANLKQEISIFHDQQAATIVKEIDAKTGNVRILVRFTSPSRKIMRKAYRVVQDTRSALDHLMIAATKCLEGKVSGTKTYFPFAHNPDNFDQQFKVSKSPKTGRKIIGGSKDISLQIAPLLKDFEPWYSDLNHSGGNDTLRHLGKIANKNKHEIALSVMPQIAGAWGQSFEITKTIEFPFPPRRIDSTDDFLVVEIAPGGTFKAGNTSLEYFITLTRPHPKIPADAFAALTEMFEISSKITNEVMDFCKEQMAARKGASCVQKST